MGKDYKYLVCTRCFTYNHAHYIVNAMNGFTIQETSFPVITLIVDDASTDGEPEVIQQYLEEYFQEPYRKEETDYAQIICAKHKTNVNCEFVVILLKFNHYRKKSKKSYISEWWDHAKYIALCEGDDYWIAPDKLENQVRFLEANPEYSMSHTNFSIFRENQNKLIVDELYNNRIKEMNIDGIVKPESIIHGYTIQTATVVFRRDMKNQMVLNDPFLYSGNFMMGDTQLWFGLNMLGKIHFDERRMAVYRKHDNSATMKTSFKKRMRFSLSCWELNYYLANNYDFSIKEKERISKEFGKRLAIYRLLQPSYHSIIENVFPLPVTEENNFLLLLEEYWAFLKYKMKSVLYSLRKAL